MSPCGSWPFKGADIPNQVIKPSGSAVKASFAAVEVDSGVQGPESIDGRILAKLPRPNPDSLGPQPFGPGDPNAVAIDQDVHVHSRMVKPRSMRAGQPGGYRRGGTAIRQQRCRGKLSFGNPAVGEPRGPYSEAGGPGNPGTMMVAAGLGGVKNRPGQTAHHEDKQGAQMCGPYCVGLKTCCPPPVQPRLTNPFEDHHEATDTLAASIVALALGIPAAAVAQAAKRYDQSIARKQRRDRRDLRHDRRDTRNDRRDVRERRARAGEDVRSGDVIRRRRSGRRNARNPSGPARYAWGRRDRRLR